jgi:hypothetical protein
MGDIPRNWDDPLSLFTYVSKENRDEFYRSAALGRVFRKIAVLVRRPRLVFRRARSDEWPDDENIFAQLFWSRPHYNRMMGLFSRLSDQQLEMLLELSKENLKLLETATPATDRLLAKIPGRQILSIALLWVPLLAFAVTTVDRLGVIPKGDMVRQLYNELGMTIAGILHATYSEYFIPKLVFKSIMTILGIAVLWWLANLYGYVSHHYAVETAARLQYLIDFAIRGRKMRAEAGTPGSDVGKSVDQPYSILWT